MKTLLSVLSVALLSQTASAEIKIIGKNTSVEAGLAQLLAIKPLTQQSTCGEFYFKVIENDITVSEYIALFEEAKAAAVTQEEAKAAQAKIDQLTEIQTNNATAYKAACVKADASTQLKGQAAKTACTEAYKTIADGVNGAGKNLYKLITDPATKALTEEQVKAKITEILSPSLEAAGAYSTDCIDQQKAIEVPDEAADTNGSTPQDN